MQSYKASPSTPIRRASWNNGDGSSLGGSLEVLDSTSNSLSSSMDENDDHNRVITPASNSSRHQPIKPRSMAYRQQLQQRANSASQQRPSTTSQPLLRRAHQNNYSKGSLNNSDSEPQRHIQSGRIYSSGDNDTSISSVGSEIQENGHSMIGPEATIINQQTSIQSLLRGNSKVNVDETVKQQLHLDDINNTIGNDSFGSEVSPFNSARSQGGSQSNLLTNSLPKLGFNESQMVETPASGDMAPYSERDSLPNMTTPMVKNMGSFNFNEEDIYAGKIRFEHFSEIIKQLDDIKAKFDDRVNDLTLGITFFDKSLISEQAKCREALIKGFISVVKQLAQDKIPEVYLRSVPKFGGNASMVVLHKSLLELRRATSTTNPQHSLLVKLDTEMSLEIEEIAKRSIETILSDFIGSLSTSNDRIAKGVKTMKQTNKTLENMLHDLKSENLFLLEKINHLEGVNLIQQEEIDTLKIEMSRRAAEIDIIKEQVTRRDKLLDEQRSNYLNELVQLQMKLFETSKVHKSGNSFRPPSSTGFTTLKDTSAARAPTPVSSFTTPYDEAEAAQQSDLELSKIVKLHQKELEKMIEERFETFKAQYIKEKRKSERSHKEELERKEVELNKLKKTINNLERSLKELSLSASMQFEVSEIRKGYGSDDYESDEYESDEN